MDLRAFVAIASMFFALHSSIVSAQDAPVVTGPLFIDPVALYGPRVEYDILRNGEKVGSHQITFTKRGDTTTVETQAKIDVPFLFFSGYRFLYRSTSQWNGKSFTSLTATTDDDGTQSKVTMLRDSEKLIMTGPSGTLDVNPSLLPIEHWSLAFVQNPDVLNPISGHVNHITETKLGSAFVPAAHGIIRADRYRLDGDIQLETWYDPAGRWLGMRFAGEDGSTIEYRCRDCPAQMAKAQ